MIEPEILRDIATNGAGMAPFVRVYGAGVRHNPRMPRLRVLALCALLALVGCEAGQQPATPAKAGVSASALTNGMEFSGERDCVDCDGIESWLRLEQTGKVRRYRMVEIYYGQDHERRFEDIGEWNTQGEVLRLRSSEGGERVYARLVDGRLQARGAHGQPLPAAADDVMIPVTFDSAH